MASALAHLEEALKANNDATNAACDAFTMIGGMIKELAARQASLGEVDQLADLVIANAKRLSAAVVTGTQLDPGVNDQAKPIDPQGSKPEDLPPPQRVTGTTVNMPTTMIPADTSDNVAEQDRRPEMATIVDSQDPSNTRPVFTNEAGQPIDEAGRAPDTPQHTDNEPNQPVTQPGS